MKSRSDGTTVTSATIRSRFLRTLSAMLATVSLVSCATNSATSPKTMETASNVQQLTERDNGTTVRLRVGDSIAITLPENPTTGYTWTVDDASDAWLKALPPTRDRTSTAMGAGERVTFTFVAQTAGSGTISLTHSRPWEGPASTIGRFSVSVVAGE